MNKEDLLDAVEKYNEIRERIGMHIILLIALSLAFGLGMVYAWGYLGFVAWVASVILTGLSVIVGGIAGMLIAAKLIIDSELDKQ